MSRPQEENSFSSRLTQFREARGLSQKQLAARVGCPANLISKLECGRQVPRGPDLYVKLCVALAVPAADLLGGPNQIAEPRLAARVRQISEQLAPEQVPVLLDLLEEAVARVNGTAAEAS
jgi:transcriptional regulator with XRE-family HTH domain